MKSYLITVLFIIISCNAQKTVTDSNSESQIKSDNPMVLILQDQSANFDTVETMVIKDQKRLKSFYSKINKTRKPGLPIPEIDFTKEMIVVHCSGEQNKDGSISLSINEETKTEIILVSKFEGQTKVPVLVKTNPFCVYKMTLTDKNVVITDR